MKERPILFSTPMIQAILEGRKTQTRRIINSQPTAMLFSAIIGGYDKVPLMARFWTKRDPNNPLIEDIKLKYSIGDILWVRETWQYTKCLNINFEDENYGYVYKASENGMDFANNIEGWTWKPSIFMPREACRIRLEITNIRVERLQDISEQDAINEGIESKKFPYCPDRNIPETIGYKIYGLKNSWDENPINSYWSLWESINGKDSWNLNLWVWVIEFKMI